MERQEAINIIYNIKYLLLDLMDYSQYDERIRKEQKKIK